MGSGKHMLINCRRWCAFWVAAVLISAGPVQAGRTVVPWMTGPRDCNTLWADVQGSVIKETSAESPAACCSMCRAMSQCGAWSYCTADTCAGDPAGRCTLKSIPNPKYPAFVSKGKGSSYALLSGLGLATNSVYITRGNVHLDEASISNDPNICSSACSGFSENDCWVIAPTDNVLSEPKEAGALKHMLNGRILDIRTSQEPVKSSILDFVTTADMRLAVAALGEVLPILICGKDMCQKYCNARAPIWAPSEKEAFRKCLKRPDKFSRWVNGKLEPLYTLEACMVQVQPIIGGHVAPRPNWCMGLDPSPPAWRCDGRTVSLGQEISPGSNCKVAGSDPYKKTCSQLYWPDQISSLCCVKDF